ncbi:hypothetical protein D1BOALGB6SA_2673 [Olavius sp. associated proteobacterium Delta 1]|nr:hypothetical protein D1BOALGB6SA_2673 [Olavius sp. associated proteobacterium Delta 1]
MVTIKIIIYGAYFDRSVAVLNPSLITNKPGFLNQYRTRLSS